MQKVEPSCWAWGPGLCIRGCGELFVDLGESKVTLRGWENCFCEFGSWHWPLSAAASGGAPAEDLSPGYFFSFYCITWSPGNWRNGPQNMELNFQLSWRFGYGCKACSEMFLDLRSWLYHLLIWAGLVWFFYPGIWNMEAGLWVWYHHILLGRRMMVKHGQMWIVPTSRLAPASRLFTYFCSLISKTSWVFLSHISF